MPNSNLNSSSESEGHEALDNKGLNQEVQDLQEGNMTNNHNITEMATAFIVAQQTMPKIPLIRIPMYNGHETDEEPGLFLKEYETCGKAQNWTDVEFLSQFPVSLKRSDRSWWLRRPTPVGAANISQKVKDDFIAEFRPPGFLELRNKMLNRRTMQHGESVNAYYDAVMKMYDMYQKDVDSLQYIPFVVDSLC